jgi:hypothetical protein
MLLRSKASWSLLLVLGVSGTAFGASACGNKSPSPVSDDIDDDASAGDDATGSGGGTTSSSGSGGSSGSSGSSGGSSGSSGSSSGTHPDAGTKPHDAGLPADADAPTISPCGPTPMCDLQTQTCCVGVDAQNQPTGKCVSHGTTCPLLTAAFNCGGASDCPKGQVCCGVATSGSADTQCATTCPTESSSSMQGQAQVCKGSAECQNKLQCIPQTCLGSANLDLCGLTSQKPFSCVAQ